MALDRAAADRQIQAARDCARAIDTEIMQDIDYLANTIKNGWHGDASQQYVIKLKGVLDLLAATAHDYKSFANMVEVKKNEIIEEERRRAEEERRRREEERRRAEEAQRQAQEAARRNTRIGGR